MSNQEIMLGLLIYYGVDIKNITLHYIPNDLETEIMVEEFKEEIFND